MYKKIFSHTAIYGLAPQIPRIAGIFILPIITQYLTEVDFGVYGLIVAVVGAMTALSNLGLNVVLSNSFYKSPMQHKWAWRQIYGFLILWQIPYTIMLGLVIYFIIPEEAAENTWLIILLNTIPVVLFGPTSFYVLNTINYKKGQCP